MDMTVDFHDRRGGYERGREDGYRHGLVDGVIAGGLAVLVILLVMAVW